LNLSRPNLIEDLVYEEKNMPNYEISLTEKVYHVACPKCGNFFYLKVDYPDGSYSNIRKILNTIHEWDCNDHPTEGCLAELS
jgi:hypothetical protein